MRAYYEKGHRAIGVCRPEVFKLHLALWWLYITLDWSQSPYRIGSKEFSIFVVRRGIENCIM